MVALMGLARLHASFLSRVSVMENFGKKKFLKDTVMKPYGRLLDPKKIILQYLK